MGEDQYDAECNECTEHGLIVCHEAYGKAHSMPEWFG